MGFCYLAYDEWRSRSTGTESTREGALADRKQKRAEKTAKKNAVRAAYQRAYEAERIEREQRQVPEDERSAP